MELGNKHWFGTLHADSVWEVCGTTANEGTEKLQLKVSQNMLD